MAEKIPAIVSAVVWIVGKRDVPTVMEKDSIAPCMFSIAPPTPDFIALDAVAEAPSQFCKAWVISSILPGVAFIMVCKPDNASVPKIVARAFSLASSVNPAVAVCSSAIICPMDFILPSLSKKEMPSCSIASLALSVGFAIETNMERNVVPACSPCKPASTMTPVAAANSSILIPIAEADGAAYLNAYCKSDTPAAVRFADSASTSATWVASPALSPNVFKTLETVSATSAKSSPEASAAEMIPGISAMISLASAPFAAISVIASATSELDREVLAPNSSADARRACSSSSVEPEIAPTFRICVSKSMAESAAFFSPAVASPAAAVSTAAIFPPKPLMASPADCRWEPMF